MEDRLRTGFQRHRGHRLRYPVTDSGHPGQTDTSPACLRDLHALDRGKEIRAGRHAIPQLVQVALQVLPELPGRHPVHPGCALAGPDPLIRLPHHRFGMPDDLALACGLDPFTWLLPGTPVDHQTGPGRPAPFTPPPLQGLHRYYEAVRPPAAHRYSAPCSFRCLETSLTPAGLNTPAGSIAARVPAFRTGA
jgi:hypothetical protein